MIPIILSGGHGTQLWPLSRQEVPKQFLPIVTEHTLLQDTINFVQLIKDIKPLITVSSKRHRFMLAEQIAQLNVPVENMLLEPLAKNTAPAIILAALTIQEKNPSELLLLIPSDHVISDQKKIVLQIEQAQTAAKDGSWIILRKDSDKSLNSSCGIHIVKCDELINQAQKHCPTLLKQCQKVYQASSQEKDFLWIDEETFSHCESLTINQAMINKLDNITQISMQGQWQKINHWTSLWDVLPKDKNNNSLQGDVIAQESTNSYIHSEKKLVATIGIDNLIVIETDDAVMVAHKDKADQVSQIVEQLKQQKRKEVCLHLKVERPWGWYDSVDTGERHQAKRIMVKPGAKLSLQSHHHRAEHWIVVKGTALVTKDEEKIMLKENESVYIPIAMKHSLENPGKIPLEIIEVQTGEYLGEDDIVRYEDVYGRVKEQC